MDELRTALRTARLERGWSQRELAEATGVTIRTISAIECGHAGTLHTVTRMAEALGLCLMLAPPPHKRTLRPCGTVAAHRRHVARQEKCLACREAERARDRIRKRRPQSVEGACGRVVYNSVSTESDRSVAA